jgi:hypothetical protein
MGVIAWDSFGLHRARQTSAECACRELQRKAARRVPQPTMVWQPRGGPGNAAHLAGGPQQKGIFRKLCDQRRRSPSPFVPVDPGILDRVCRLRGRLGNKGALISVFDRCPSVESSVRPEPHAAGTALRVELPNGAISNQRRRAATAAAYTGFGWRAASAYARVRLPQRTSAASRRRALWAPSQLTTVANQQVLFSM